MRAQMKMAAIIALAVSAWLMITIVVWTQCLRQSFSYSLDYPSQQLSFGGEYKNGNTLTLYGFSCRKLFEHPLNDQCPLTVRVGRLSIPVYKLTQQNINQVIRNNERVRVTVVNDKQTIWVAEEAEGVRPRYLITCVFKDEQIVSFAYSVSAQHNAVVEDGNVSPFTFTLGEDRSLPVPISLQELEKVIGPPTTTRRSLRWP